MKTRNLYILITIVITWWALTSCSAKFAVTVTHEKVAPEAIEKTLGDSENLFRQREDPDKLRTAIKMLSAVRDADNRNYQVEWTFSKYNYFLGKLTSNEQEAEASLGQGRDAGKIAKRVDPQKPDGYFWYGANLGELSKRSPITVGLSSVDEIKDAMNKVIELQPDYQGASSYDALAQVELATRIKGGDAQKAVEFLEKGLQLAPENTNIRVHLAEAYLAVKRDADARNQLDYVLQMKPNPEYLPEYRESAEKARKLIQTNF
ncbi:MAG: TRAP transporter TatT component family protein [Acidobacteriota bacterium]